ncbi:MAG: hypothetical protein M0P57_08770 [Syntrophales bacterium]|jgi:hypothetical protein|nr:hypothetical protein [Syntrophales bacterium]MDY0044657.1 hypothetical protein [Syntrophales bacterium]
MELLRAGFAFHTRGLINTRAIQHNLDWIWPYWVEKQFNPADASFLPRAYSLTHVNLTQRNWTAVGQPDLPLYPLADPRGLITPLYDGWSVDFWIYREQGEWLIPSRQSNAEQHLEFSPDLSVITRCCARGSELAWRLKLNSVQKPSAVIEIKGASEGQAFLAVSLRPYNPEGIQFIETITYDEANRLWVVNGKTSVILSETPDKILFSNYEHGDVVHRFMEHHWERSVECPVGMATSSALFKLKKGGPREIIVRISLDKDMKEQYLRQPKSLPDWQSVTAKAASLKIPDHLVTYIYNAAVRTLILLSAREIFPGPYTYRRFWFRDACLMINALMSLGYTDRAFRLLNSFPLRQERSGYFQSQEGEWDSNGQVLWILDRYLQLTGDDLPKHWRRSALKGAWWIIHKRTPKKEGPHGGLLPAGFSAEHLGPNDYYYWDDFWGVAGLKAAARIAGMNGPLKQQQAFLREAADFEETIFQSISEIPDRRKQGGIPASVYRRMDSGAVGSLAADYPLQITSAGDPAIGATVDFLLAHCFYDGGFFQDMIHSGINVYLTLSIAQTLLRNEDTRYRSLIDRMSELASPTGHWPEAVHPLTGGGCMGDGQHGWAAAEWIQIVRNLFVREEEDTLILGSGIFPRWIKPEGEIVFGPTPTPFGKVKLKIRTLNGKCLLEVDAVWRKPPPKIEVRIPGFQLETPDNIDEPLVLRPLEQV